MKTIMILLISFFSFICVAAYEFKASRGRFDGILISISPTYNHLAELWVTMSPEICYAAQTPTPLPAQAAFYQIPIGMNMFFPSFDQFFHSEAPEGVDLCYIFTGRGIVEGSAWGQRATNYNLPPPATINDVIQLTASKNLSEAVEIKVEPRLQEFADLYVTPDADNCPAVGKPFSFQGRYAKVMEKIFNGYYHKDLNAAYEVDLCYFLIAKKSRLIIANGWGYRKL